MTDTDTPRRAQVIDTANLEICNLHATTRHYNRTLSSKGLEMLDPNGTHIITFTMVHEHAAGVKVDPHIRCKMMLKIKDSMTPVDAFVDMTFKDFNERVITLQKNEQDEWEQVHSPGMTGTGKTQVHAAP